MHALLHCNDLSIERHHGRGHVADAMLYALLMVYYRLTRITYTNYGTELHIGSSMSARARPDRTRECWKMKLKSCESERARKLCTIAGITRLSHQREGGC